MATRTVTSNSITFMDTSDERKLEVSVEANLPTVQIYNPNNSTYNPDWKTTNLILTACVTLDLIDITNKTDNPKPTIEWYQVNSSGTKTKLGTGTTLTILSNLSSSTTYICEAAYDGLTAKSQMTFTRVEAGAKGAKGDKGANGSDGINGITFQIYGDKGLVLTEDAPKTTLQAFAYDGYTDITKDTGIKYKWYYQNISENSSGTISSSWVEISGATNSSYEISKSDVFKKTAYKCEMTYNGNTYYATAVVEDKNDIYDGIINIYDTIKTEDGKCYWVLYASVYYEEGEKDGLLGPISTSAPDINSDSDYYYRIDIDNKKVDLYEVASSGTSWTKSSKSHSLTYNWIINGNKGNKIQIVSSDDFKETLNVVCEVSDNTGIIARSFITLTNTHSGDIDGLGKRLAKYEHSVQIKDNGITITATDDNGQTSPFSSRFTATKLAFLYDPSKANNITEATDYNEEALTKLKLTAQGIYVPNIKIGNLKFIKETNGSYSITV